MLESWLLRKRVEARIFIGELTEALHHRPADDFDPGSDDDWAGAGFAVERVEGHFGGQGR